MKELLRSTAKRCLRFVIPPRCDLCGDVVFPDECRCEKCEAALRPTGKLCKKCGLPTEDCKCDEHKFRNEYAEFVAPLYFHDSIAKGLIRFKSYGYTELADGYAKEIAKCVRERYDGVAFDCVTYVPMRRLRQWHRGYNLGKLLADAVSAETGVPCEDLLIKTRNTKSQRFSTAKERRVNLHGAFDLPLDKEVADKTVLLIDDVKTTGSTLNECALTLRAYGAKAVYAAAAEVVNENIRNNN